MSHKQVSVSVVGQGEEVRRYPGLGRKGQSGTPLISEFFFSYGRGFGRNVDHHLKTIKVEPDGPVDGMPHDDNENIRLAFHDKNGDDDFTARVTHTLVSDLPRHRVRISRSGGVSSSGSTGALPLVAPPDPEMFFVLAGFELTFTHTDHHTDEIGIEENNGKLTCWLNDRNNDDAFEGFVDFVWVPPSYVSEYGSAGTTDRDESRATISDEGTPVLRGFKFDYVRRGKDTHIRKLKVALKNGEIRVAYGDKSPSNDPYSWKVHWLTLRED